MLAQYLLACQHITICIANIFKGDEMSGAITGVRLRKDRAELLREKSIELTIKEKKHIRETELINFLIDEFAERIDTDKNGLFIKEEDE